MHYQVAVVMIRFIRESQSRLVVDRVPLRKVELGSLGLNFSEAIVVLESTSGDSIHTTHTSVSNLGMK